MLFVVLLLFCAKKNEKADQKKKKKEKRFSSFSLEGEKTNHTTKERREKFCAEVLFTIYIHTQSLFVFSLTEEEEEEDKWRSSTTRASIRFIT